MDRVEALSAAIHAHRETWQRCNGKRRGSVRPADLALWDAYDEAMAETDPADDQGRDLSMEQPPPELASREGKP